MYSVTKDALMEPSMFPRCLVLGPVLLLAFFASSARAFFDPPWISPAAPIAGDVVSVNIRDGVCDAIFFRPGYPQITQQGNLIHLVEYGHHWDTDDLCIYDIGHLVEPIGAFSAGHYTLMIDLFFIDALGFPQILSIGSVSFNVADVTPVARVPALTAPGQFALVCLVLGAALFALRMQ
jgi:hypothetical protein